MPMDQIPINKSYSASWVTIWYHRLYGNITHSEKSDGKLIVTTTTVFGIKLEGELVWYRKFMIVFSLLLEH